MSSNASPQRTANRMNALTTTFGMSSSSTTNASNAASSSSSFSSSFSPSSPSSSSSSSSSLPPITRVMVPNFLTIVPQLDELRTLRDNLENSLSHLQRTQRELEVLILDEPMEKEYKEALAENKPVIEKFFNQIKEIQKLIITLTAHQGHGNTVVFIPEDEWVAADEIANDTRNGNGSSSSNNNDKEEGGNDDNHKSRHMMIGGGTSTSTGQATTETEEGIYL